MVPFSLVPWLASFVRRPKLKVEYTPLDGMSFAGPHPGMLTVRWKYRLTITNLSNEDALELAVIRTNDPGLESLGAHHIKGLEALVVERRLEKAIPKDVVVAAQHKFHGALEPSELKELAVLLRYKSSNGVTRHTDYLRSRGEQANAWSFREPKRER